MHPAGLAFANLAVAARMDVAFGKGKLCSIAATARRVLVIAGPTGVGKSSAGMQVASEVGGEIVGADSVQIFRHLDLGSNKSSALEREKVPHHMVDIADVVDGDYSAGRFLDAARAATDKIHGRERIPIVVGGTMMYLRWYVRGRPATPPPTEAQRAAAAADVEAAGGDWDTAVAILAKHDAVRAASLTRNDWYRLSRSLQVAHSVPGGVSSLPQVGASPNCGENGGASPYDLRCVFLFDDRVELNRRVDTRVERMVVTEELMASPPKCGETALSAYSILAETAHLLLAIGAKVTDSSPSRAIGYRQTIQYLVKLALEDNDDELVALRAYVADFQSATRSYCKQQFAWFRKDPHFRWVPAQNAAEACTHLLSLDADEYRALCEETADEQRQIHNSILEMGKRMRTYLPQRTILTDGSEAESIAIDCARLLANELRQRISLETLRHIADRVAK